MKTLEKGTTARILAEREAATAVPTSIRSYAEAERVLAGGRGDRRKLANNTYLVRRDGGQIAVMLHDTDIVTYWPDGYRVTFNSGGWRTATTRERINQYSPARITEQDGVWLIGVATFSQPAAWTQVTFADGIQMARIYDSRGLTYGYDWHGAGSPLAEMLALRDRIKRYVEGFMQRFDRNEVAAPSSGDCWHCLFASGDNALEVGTPSTDHLLTHMDEGHFVPSLVVTACKRYPVSDVARQYLRAKWHLGNTLLATTTERVGRAQVKSALMKYLMAQFGLVGK